MGAGRIYEANHHILNSMLYKNPLLQNINQLQKVLNLYLQSARVGNIVEKEKMLVNSNFSFFPQCLQKPLPRGC